MNDCVKIDNKERGRIIIAEQLISLAVRNFDNSKEKQVMTMKADEQSANKKIEQEEFEVVEEHVQRKSRIPYNLGNKSHFLDLNFSLYFAYFTHGTYRKGSYISMNQKNMRVLSEAVD